MCRESLRLRLAICSGSVDAAHSTMSPCFGRTPGVRRCVQIIDVNVPPAVLSSSTVVVPENLVVGTLVYTFATSDEHNQPVTHTIVSGNANGALPAFSMEAATGKMFVASYQRYQQGPRRYLLLLSAVNSPLPGFAPATTLFNLTVIIAGTWRYRAIAMTGRAACVTVARVCALAFVCEASLVCRSPRWRVYNSTVQR